MNTYRSEVRQVGGALWAFSFPTPRQACASRVPAARVLPSLNRMRAASARKFSSAEVKKRGSFRFTEWRHGSPALLGFYQYGR